MCYQYQISISKLSRKKCDATIILHFEDALTMKSDPKLSPAYSGN